MTGKSNPSEKLRALFLAALMVFSVLAGSMAFAGTAAAANTSAGNSSISPSQVATDSTNDHTITLSATDVDTSGDGNQVFVVQLPNALDLSSSQITNAQVNEGAVTTGSTNVDSTNNYVNLTVQDDTSATGSTSSDEVSVTYTLESVTAPSSSATAQAQFGIDADASGVIGDSAGDAALTDFQQLVIGSSGVNATAVTANATFDTTTGDAVDVTVEHNDSANSAAIALYDDTGNEVFEYNDGSSGPGIVNIDQSASGETVFTLDVEAISNNNDFNLGSGTIYASATDAGAGTSTVTNDDFDVQTEISLGGLDVTSVTGPRVAANDTEVDYTVNLSNTGSAEVTQDVSLLASSDGGDISTADPLGTSTILGTQSDVTVSGQSDTQVTFTVNTADLPGATSGANNYEIAGFTQGSPIGFSSTNLVSGSNSEGSVTINVVDDTSEQQEGVDVELWLEGDFDDQNLVLAEKTTNAQGSVTFTGLAVGADSNNPIRYTARAGANQPDLSSTTTTLSLFEPTQTSDSSTVVTDRLVQPERIEVEQDKDSAVADGSDEITFTATVYGGVDDVPNSGDDRPIEGADVTVSDNGESITYNPPGAVSNGEHTYETDENGEVTFTVSSDVVQTVDFTFEGGDGSTDALTETRTKEFVLAGEGSLAGTVNDQATTNPIEDASVWVVNQGDYDTNQNLTTVDVSSTGFDEETIFIRLVDNETGQIINNDDYDLRRATEGTYVRKVNNLNESDAAVGQGYALIDANDNGTIQFTHTRLADEEYYAQVSLDAENSSASPGVIDVGTENFVNVSAIDTANGNLVTNTGTNDPVVFEPTANLTLEAAESLASLTGANYVDSPGFVNSYGYDTDGTTDDGRFVLNKLPTNFQNGTGYVAIATDAGFSTDFADVTITEDGQLTFAESQGSNEFFLEPVETDPDGVDIKQIGTRDGLNGALVEFPDQSDDTFQEVSRDGQTIDVFQINTSEEGALVNATATVSFDDTSVAGEFVAIASGEFTNRDNSTNTATLYTGSDGQAEIWFQADQDPNTVSTQKRAVLEADSSVTDESNVTFVGVLESKSAEVSGIVTDSNNQPVPSVVYTSEITVGGTDFTVAPATADMSEFTITRLDNSGNAVETVTVTRDQAENYQFDTNATGAPAFPGVSLDSSVSDLTLVTASTSGVQESSSYTLPRVPATDSGLNNVAITAVSQASIDSANSLSDLESGTSVTTRTEVNRTSTANVEISGAAGAAFAVTNVTAEPANASQGETVTVEATIENQGAVTAEADVTYLFGETVGDATEQDSTTTSPIVTGETETVTFTLDTSDIDAGDYVHVIETADDTGTADQTITESSSNNTNGNLVRFDTNNNGQIDQQEVVDAINAFYNDSEIGGEPVEQSDVVAAINAFYNDTQL